MLKQFLIFPPFVLLYIVHFGSLEITTALSTKCGASYCTSQIHDPMAAQVEEIDRRGI